jgi:hypothetical protein
MVWYANQIYLYFWWVSPCIWNEFCAS